MKKSAGAEKKIAKLEDEGAVLTLKATKMVLEQCINLLVCGEATDEKALQTVMKTIKDAADVTMPRTVLDEKEQLLKITALENADVGSVAKEGIVIGFAGDSQGAAE